MAEIGEVAPNADLPQPLDIKLSNRPEQHAILAALTSFIARSDRKEGELLPRAKVAKGLFAQLSHQIDEDVTGENVSLNLKTKDEQSVLKSALLLKAQADTAEDIYGRLKEPDKTHLPLIRHHLAQLAQDDELFTEKYKLLTGAVDDISDVRLKEISTDSDPKYAGFIPYAMYFLHQREETSHS